MIRLLTECVIRARMNATARHRPASGLRMLVAKFAPRHNSRSPGRCPQPDSAGRKCETLSFRSVCLPLIIQSKSHRHYRDELAPRGMASDQTFVVIRCNAEGSSVTLEQLVTCENGVRIVRALFAGRSCWSIPVQSAFDLGCGELSASNSKASAFANSPIASQIRA